MKYEILIGRKFGLLTVVGEVQPDRSGRKWICKCECGKTKIASSGNLRAGNVKSCGCLYGKASIIHGKWNFRLHRIWSSMIRRCSDISNRYYGGKGVRVCKTWLIYDNFEKWAFKNGYSNSLTIDRIKSDKDYKPSNCRWVTYKVQNNNRSNNTILVVNGIRKTISEWSGVFGISQGRISRRINNGWDAERAVKTGIDKNKISKCYRK